jgi:hypothetical protein
LTQPLKEMSTRNIFLGGKGGRCVGLTTLPHSCADCLEIWESSGPLQACNGIALPLLLVLTPWSIFLLEKLTGSQLVKKFPKFYGTGRFITAFTSSCLLSLSLANSFQSIP